MQYISRLLVIASKPEVVDEVLAAAMPQAA